MLVAINPLILSPLIFDPWINDSGGFSRWYILSVITIYFSRKIEPITFLFPLWITITYLFSNFAQPSWIFYSLSLSLYFTLARQFSIRFAPLFIFILSFIGILQFLGFQWIPQAAPPAITFVNRNLAAAFIATLFPLAFLQILKENKPWQLSFLLLPLTYLLVCGSRTPILSLILAFGLSYFWKLLLPSIFILPLFISFDFSSLMGRFAIGINSFGIIRDFPIFGTGPESFVSIFPLYHKIFLDPPKSAYTIFLRPEHAHNDYIQFGVEYGIIGMIALIGITIWGIIRARGLWRTSLITTSIISLFDFPLQFPCGAYLFVFILSQVLPHQKEIKFEFRKPLIALYFIIFISLHFCLSRTYIALAYLEHRIIRAEIVGGMKEIQWGAYFFRDISTTYALLQAYSSTPPERKIEMLNWGLKFDPFHIQMISLKAKLQPSQELNSLLSLLWGPTDE